MKKKTILALAAVAVVGGAVAIPAIASGWMNGNCGPGAGWRHGGPWGGPGMMHGGPGMMGGHPMRGPWGGPSRGMGPMNSSIFKSFDTDKDGSVTAEEITKGVATLHAQYDADNSGGLSAEEFLKLHTAATQDFAERPFRMLDGNNDGQISAEEMSFPAKMMAWRFAPVNIGTEPEQKN